MAESTPGVAEAGRGGPQPVAVGYSRRVPSLFRRRSSEFVPDAADAKAAPDADASGATGADASRPRAYTPSKRERGEVTPKRRDSGARRKAEPPPANRREAYKRMRDKERAEREERRQAMLNGDERYLLARDRGPERALVRDLVDSRRTVGTWFFAGALIVLVGSQPALPTQVRFVSNMLWIFLAFATVADSVLISRKIGKLVRERFPKSTERPTGLYFYGVLRGLTFRRMRMPKPRVRLGQKI